MRSAVLVMWLASTAHMGCRDQASESASSASSQASVAAYRDDGPCSGRAEQPCVDYARALVFGENGSTRDPDRGKRLALMACEAGTPSGCTLVGLAFSSVFGSALEAAKWLERGCNLGDGSGCAALAYQFFNGGLPGEAQGVRVSTARAAALAQRACDLQEQRGCTLLARAYANGDGVERDLVRALSLATDACRADDAAGCSVAAQIARHDGDTDAGSRFQERSCALGNQFACTHPGGAVGTRGF